MKSLLHHLAVTFQKHDLRGWVLPLLALLVWQTVTWFEWVDTRLIVPPGGVFAVAHAEMQSSAFWLGVAASLGRDLLGFALGSIAGIVFGCALALSRVANSLLSPSFHVIRQISLFAWVPLLSVYLGYGELSKLVLIALAVFYPVALSTHEGVAGIERKWLEVARVYEFNRKQFVWRLLLPAASPQIFTGLQLGLIYAWLGTIGAEFLLRSYDTIGLGETIFRGRAAFNIELIVFGMLVVGLVGYLLSQGAMHFERQALRWRSSY